MRLNLEIASQDSRDTVRRPRSLDKVSDELAGDPAAFAVTGVTDGRACGRIARGPGGRARASALRVGSAACIRSAEPWDSVAAAPETRPAPRLTSSSAGR